VAEIRLLRPATMAELLLALWILFADPAPIRELGALETRLFCPAMIAPCKDWVMVMLDPAPINPLVDEVVMVHEIPDPMNAALLVIRWLRPTKMPEKLPLLILLLDPAPIPACVALVMVILVPAPMKESVDVEVMEHVDPDPMKAVLELEIEFVDPATMALDVELVMLDPDPVPMNEFVELE
jgi:hypothetical protein